MEKLKAYNIKFAQLSFEKHHFEYKITDDFIDQFEQDVLKKINMSINLELTKGEALTELYFSFDGLITLACDRSLEEYETPLNFKRALFLKYGEEYEELDEKFIQIPTNFQEINVSQFIYEFILLQLPQKKLHPKFDGEEDFFFSTETEEQEITEDNIDPMWADLKKIKNKK